MKTKRLRSKPRFCFRENQNKETETFSNGAPCRKLLGMLYGCKKFRELDHRLSIAEAGIQINSSFTMDLSFMIHKLYHLT